MLLATRAAIIVGLFGVIGSAVLQGQWINVPGAEKPDLTAPVPRLSNGKPDLSGIWAPRNGGRYAINIAADLKPEDVPFQPSAKTLFDSRVTGAHSREDPGASCLPPGVPVLAAAPYPWKLIQQPGFILIAYETFNLWRQFFLDGRELSPDANPAWMGYSTGTWQGDTLRVDSRGFNGKTWLDMLGHPTSDSLHLVERLHRKDFGHMTIEITIDDPQVYTRPWSVNEEFLLRPDTELMEFVCNENNRDLIHLSGDRSPVR